MVAGSPDIDKSTADRPDYSDESFYQPDMTTGRGRNALQLLGWVFGWLVVRPIRYASYKAYLGYRHPVYWPQADWWHPESLRYLRWPNFYLWPLGWLLYRVGHFLSWSSAWPLSRKVAGRYRHTWAAGAARCFGRLLCWHLYGCGCFHCNAESGDPTWLSYDETGKTFILRSTWTVGTPDGTDYRFNGTTICPRCGYREYYEGGSL